MVYGSEEIEMQNYLKAGEKRALSLSNRGPLKFNNDGTLHKEIIASYSENGFYIFEKVFSYDELLDWEKDYLNIIERFPVNRTSKIDMKGRPAIASECKANILYWSKPLADPFGGTDLANGRPPVKMIEPKPKKDDPD